MPTRKTTYSPKMSIAMVKLALSQNVTVLRETMKKNQALSGIALPDNLEDLMYETMSAKGEQVPLVSVRDILYSKIPLPFMPDRIDYKIGKGCCDEIVKCDGLFVPCSKHCDGDKCAAHLKKSSGLGNYWERHAAWSKHEPYCVIIKEKEVKEKSYGTYLHGKNLDSTAVSEELSKWGVSLSLDPSLFRIPAKPLKKSRGRKATKKVESTESDDEKESESEKSESESEKSAEKSGSEGEKSDEESEKPKKKALPRWQPEGEDDNSEDEKSEDESEKPKEIKKKAPKAPKEPKPPKAPKEPKVPKAPKEPKAPKAPKEPKAPKAPKEPKVPKEKAAPKAKPVPEYQWREPEPESDDEISTTVPAPDPESDDEIISTKVPEPEPDSDDEISTTVPEPEPESEPESDGELEAPESDDEEMSLGMLSKAKPKAPEPKAPEPKAPEPKAPEPKKPEPKKPEPKKAEPKAETKKPEPKKRSSSPGELKKEEMEKTPKKGAIYRGKPESLSEVDWGGDTFLYKDGRYYTPEKKELVAWDNKGVFELL
jgi:hypothetical protein